jgi:hypothetical protein
MLSTMHYIPLDKLLAAAAEAARSAAVYDARMARSQAEMLERVVATREVIAQSLALLAEIDAVLGEPVSQSSQVVIRSFHHRHGPSGVGG